jgi:hypothetical protein
LPQALEIEQVNMGEIEGLGWHSSKRWYSAIAVDLPKYRGHAVRWRPRHRLNHHASAGTPGSQRHFPSGLQHLQRGHQWPLGAPEEIGQRIDLQALDVIVAIGD